MDHIERVQCVLEGRRPDRPPVSFWHHFPSDQVCGRPAAEAHVAHLDAFDLDFLKVMNDNGYPLSSRLHTAQDLASLTILRGDEPEFARQLDLLAELKRRLRDRVWMTTTLFNAYATLRRLVGPAKIKHGPPNLDATDDRPTAIIRGFLDEDPEAVKSALGTIGASLSNFARRCIEAGADGIFLSVRDDWLDSRNQAICSYDALVRASDLDILAGASAGRFNLLHICGCAVNFRAFAEYPVHGINWADRAAGPSMAEVCTWVRPALCGGIDNLSTLPNGTERDCENEVADALRQAKNRPIMIAPGCTYDPEVVPRSNLEAVRRAALNASSLPSGHGGGDTG